MTQTKDIVTLLWRRKERNHMGKGTWVTSGYRRGDMPIFDFGEGIAHIGMMLGQNADGSYQTVEGNTGGTSEDNGGIVLEKTRYASQIVGCCRPPYPSTEVMEEIIARLVSQIGVSEWPPDSNNVEYNTWYYGHDVSGPEYSWCVVFQAWGFFDTNHFDLFADGEYIASCTQLALHYGYGSESGGGSETNGGTNTVNITLDQLQQGSSGAQVVTLQRLLNAVAEADGNSAINCGDTDGDFGPKTNGAVMAFQASRSLQVDGIVGGHTWEALLK